MTLSSAEKHSDACPWKFPVGKEEPIYREYPREVPKGERLPESSPVIFTLRNNKDLLEEGKQQFCATLQCFCVVCHC